MRILKYFFLLLVLALVGVSVFVATQKGTFDIVQSRVIKSPRNIVYTYVDEFRNWENFGAWAKADTDMKFSYPSKTSGKGASYSWESSKGDGKLTTIFAKENDSLYQRMEFDGAQSEVSWKFKDTVGGTKVTWRSKGRMSFMFKVLSITQGGVGKMLGAMQEQSLANLDKTLDYEINTFKIEPEGIVSKTGAMYLKQSISSTLPNAARNSRIMIANLLHFFKKNNIPMAGKPFAIYHSYDNPKGVTKFSVCIPISEEIRTSPESDITFGKLDGFRAVKVTLTGDYSHQNQAWKAASDYMSKNKLENNPNMKALQVYTKGIEEIKSPSQWVTHIYFPLQNSVTPAVSVPAASATVPSVEAQTSSAP